MNLIAFFPCRTYKDRSDGLIDLLGVGIYEVRTIKGTKSNWAFVLGFMVDKPESHKIEMSIINPIGHETDRAKARLPNPIPIGGTVVRSEFPLKFDFQGQYSFRLFVDDAEISRYDLNVVFS